jgi:predicted kinase
MTSTLFIIRGISGSGKSYLARHVAPQENICSAVDFMIGADFKSPDRDQMLAAAHQKCMEKAWDVMRKGAKRVVIDNTNLRLRHFSDYLDMAVDLDFNVQSLVVNNPWSSNISECARRTPHGVPMPIIVAQANSWES